MKLYFVYPEKETILSCEVVKTDETHYYLDTIWALETGTRGDDSLLSEIRKVSKVLPENVTRRMFSARKLILNHLRRQELELQKKIAYHQQFIDEELENFDADEFDRIVNGE